MAVDSKGWEKDVHKAIQYHSTQRAKNEKVPEKHEYHRSREVELREALKEHQLNHWGK